MVADEDVHEVISLRLQKAERQIRYMLEAVTYGIGCPHTVRLRRCEKREGGSTCYECWKAVLEKV